MATKQNIDDRINIVAQSNRFVCLHKKLTRERKRERKEDGIEEILSWRNNNQQGMNLAAWLSSNLVTAGNQGVQCDPSPRLVLFVECDPCSMHESRASVPTHWQSWSSRWPEEAAALAAEERCLHPFAAAGWICGLSRPWKTHITKPCHKSGT